MSDSINRVPYRFGKSFRNPQVVAPVTEARRPFFDMSYLATGPTQVKEDMWKRGVYRRYPTVWRRAAKQNTVEGLAGVPSEMPNFHELGEAAPPTSETNSTERSWWGALTNSVVNAASTVLQQQGQLQLAKAQAQAPQYSFNSGMPFQMSQSGGIGVLGLSLIALGVGTVGYYFYKSRA